jgi:hypothetical protein
MNLLFPYKTLVGDVDLEVTQVKLDGHDIHSDFLDADRRLVAIEGVERQGWTAATMRIEVTAPQTEIKELVTAGARPRALAVLHGGSTNMRLGTELEVDPVNPARWSGKLELERPFWHGRLTASSTIVAEVDGIENRIIGSSHPWLIALDDLPRPPVKGNIPVTWDSFKEPRELQELRQFADEPCFVHLDPDQPVLYLNEDFPGLRPLLNDRRRRPRDVQALHDQTRVTFATEAWAAMFNVALAAAAQATDEDDPEAAWPETEWQRNVLDIVLARMYPERTADDALRESVGLLRQGEVEALHERLVTAISAQVGGARLLRSAISMLDNLESE